MHSMPLPGGVGAGSSAEADTKKPTFVHGFATSATDPLPKVELHMKLKVRGSRRD
jgi:hypothetical protein